METSLAIFGFIFGIYCLSYGLTMVNQLAKDVKNLQRQVEDIERRLPLT